MAVIGVFPDQTTDAAKAFLAAASSIDDIPFAITSRFLLYSFSVQPLMFAYLAVPRLLQSTRSRARLCFC